MRNETPQEVFEELGELRSATALHALTEDIEQLTELRAFQRAYAALRHFVDTGALEKKARSYLAGRLEHPEPTARWQAVKPLLTFGEAGVEVLRKTGLETHDEYLARRIGEALLPVLPERGNGEALARRGPGSF